MNGMGVIETHRELREAETDTSYQCSQVRSVNELSNCGTLEECLGTYDR